MATWNSTRHHDNSDGSGWPPGTRLGIMTTVTVADGHPERHCQIHQVTQDKTVLGPLQENITPKTEDLPKLPFSLNVEEDNLTEE